MKASVTAVTVVLR